ncbi:AraC family transcriptional regulator ligand-binding domain-containing protein [Pseudomonas sp. N4]|uniref:AraC family transcriptional regulator ligand-binding domain-containing protein n=2 Tax=unclassified Pseudomonas TaxID=196821 RepID=UPI0039B7699A
MSPAELIARSRLPFRLLRDDSPVSTAQFFDLWRCMVEIKGDPTVGLSLACALDGSVMPPSFLAAYHARNFRDGLLRVARFKRLCTPEELLITELDDRCELTLEWTQDNPETVPPSLIDAALVSLLEMGRRSTGVHITPISVELARPMCFEAIYTCYFGCPVQFDSGRNCLSLHRADLDRLFLSYNADLLEILAPALESKLVNQLDNLSLSAQVQWVLRRRLTAGRPDIRSVASELALSERSLQRRLTEEGESFQGLLSQTRHQLALEYLSDASVSIVEVGYMLGYEDQNSFFRAFRQWENQTPSEWRSGNGVS